MKKEEHRELRNLENTVERIDRDVDAVIVEGYSDLHYLEKLGFDGKIFMSAERTVEDLVEDVSRGADRVAVLTDFDSTGKEASSEISRELEKEIDVIHSAREEFGQQLTSTGRRCVEDVRPLFDDREQKFVDAMLDRLFMNQKSSRDD